MVWLIRFRSHPSQYLDSTFCSFFHAIDSNSADVLLYGRMVIFGVWGTALMYLALQLYRLLRVWRHARAGAKKCSKSRSAAVSHLQSSQESSAESSVGCPASESASATPRPSAPTPSLGRECMLELSQWSVMGTAARLLTLLAPPIFFEFVFLPCYECYDFEAAATHEVGHLLGLSHPDQARPGRNVAHSLLAAGTRLNSSTCQTPWDDVEPMTQARSAARSSIMLAFTQHNSQVCVQQDDLEALQVIYPDCSHTFSTPVCYRVQHNIGWVRLGVYVLVPVLLSMFLLMLFNAIVRRHHLILTRELGRIVRQKSADLRFARASLQQQQLTEASRVELAARTMSLELVRRTSFREKLGWHTTSTPSTASRTPHRKPTKWLTYADCPAAGRSHAEPPQPSGNTTQRKSPGAAVIDIVLAVTSPLRPGRKGATQQQHADEQQILVTAMPEPYSNEAGGGVRLSRGEGGRLAAGIGCCGCGSCGDDRARARCAKTHTKRSQCRHSLAPPLEDRHAFTSSATRPPTKKPSLTVQISEDSPGRLAAFRVAPLEGGQPHAAQGPEEPEAFGGGYHPSMVV